IPRGRVPNRARRGPCDLHQQRGSEDKLLLRRLSWSAASIISGVGCGRRPSVFDLTSLDPNTSRSAPYSTGACRTPIKIASLDAAMMLLFHVVAPWRGASEFNRSAASTCDEVIVPIE